MVVIRLARIGKKGSPVFRVAVADRDAKLTGRFIEKIGTYVPKGGTVKKDSLTLDMDRFNHWVKQGAQPSPRVLKVIKTNPVSTASTATRNS